METGINSNDSLRYINRVNQLFCNLYVNQHYETLDEKVCKALPAFHDFAGCDYTTSFNRKGMIKPLKILEKDIRLQDIFTGLSSAESSNGSTIEEIEKFECKNCLSRTS